MAANEKFKAVGLEQEDEERNGGAGLFLVSGCSIILSAASIGCLIPWFTSKSKTVRVCPAAGGGDNHQVGFNNAL